MNNTLLEINNIYFIFLMMAAAVPVGFFAGFFGIGGGLISVPFLFFVFEAFNVDKDYLMHLSVGTAFSITILTATASVLTHRKYNAVDFAKKGSEIIGGKGGGGRPDFAQAGGVDSSKIDEALDNLKSLI